VVLASHSPIIAADLPDAFVTNLDPGVSPSETFAAPMEQVLRNAFDSNPIGRFASGIINEVYERILQEKADDRDWRVVEKIGDAGVKAAMYRARDERLARETGHDH
jgi:hypothetical protein